MATFAQTQTAQVAKIEAMIAAIYTADPLKYPLDLWQTRAELLAGSGGGGAAAAIDYEYTDWQITTAHGAFTVGQIVRQTTVAGVSTWADFSGAAVAQPDEDKISDVGGGTATIAGGLWIPVSAQTFTPSSDDAALTSLPIPAAIAALDPEKARAYVSVLPNVDVFEVSLGGPHATLTQARAIATMQDTIRWSDSLAALSETSGEIMTPSDRRVLIEGLPKLTAFRCLSTNADFPPTMTVTFEQLT